MEEFRNFKKKKKAEQKKINKDFVFPQKKTEAQTWHCILSNFFLHRHDDSDLSKAMFRVSSCVVTTGADNLAATCSSLGCIIPRRPTLLAAAPLLFPQPCD